MDPKNIAEALDRWLDHQPHETPEDEVFYILTEINSTYDMGHSDDDIRRDAPLILAWLRDPTIIDPDHDDSETWIRRHHG